MGKLIVEGVDLTEFLGVPYVASRHPGNTSVQEFVNNPKLGANCELFSSGIRRKRGFHVDQMRSIEMWHDTNFTVEVNEAPYEPYDCFLFLPKGADPHKLIEEVKNFHELPENDINELKKFHQAVYIGPSHDDYRSGLFLHLPKPGPSCVWQFEDFAKSEKEYWLFKVKRPVLKLSQR